MRVLHGLLWQRCRRREEKGPGSLLRKVFGGTCPFHATILAHSVAGNAGLALAVPNIQWGAGMLEMRRRNRCRK